jgi:hypothetical protein
MDIPKVTAELSDMQAWLLALFLAEIDFDYVLTKMDPQHTPDHRRSNAEATVRALRCLIDQLAANGFRKHR